MDSVMKHKWHDEIVAWAGGAEIEFKQYQFGEWELMRHSLAMFDDDSFQFRIKPQPKEKKYLSAYMDYKGVVVFVDSAMYEEQADGRAYIGKIEVQDD